MVSAVGRIGPNKDNQTRWRTVPRKWFPQCAESESGVMNLRSAIRHLVPRPLRIELLRLKRLPAWFIETPTIARTRATPSEISGFGTLMASHRSPLQRTPGEVSAALQRSKEQNVAIAARNLDRLIVRPFEIFSYHRTVGRPSRLRGFRSGLELHDGKLSRGVGGGCCQVSNMLYLLALRSGMKITERFRHGADLFPDHGRTVPFGCGATIFYNYADLRFENPLPQPIVLRLRLEDQHLVGEFWTDANPGWTAEIYEAGHNRSRDRGVWIRENWIRRRFVRSDGSVLLDQEVAHNRARILYAMPDDQIESSMDPAAEQEEAESCSAPL